jgi:Copper type II ascorbate-dependent monooxygenase, C-terminal domain
MNRAGLLSLGALSLLALTACGENTAPDDETGSGGENKQWQTLIAGEWQLGAGEENVSDLHMIVVDRDIYVGAIRPIAPQGTHHAVLAVSNAFVNNTIYASGVGTNALEFPAGVGLKLKANDIVILELHVFNPSAEPISGTSGIEIIEIPPDDVEQEADLYLPGPSTLNIPPNQVSSQTGVCTIHNEQTLFALFPHMHQLGSHFKTTLNIDGEATILYDDDYDFSHQAFLPIDPITLRQGDTITTECTWTNTTPNSIGWGENSDAEMCFSIVYRYPAQEDSSFCDH